MCQNNFSDQQERSDAIEFLVHDFCEGNTEAFDDIYDIYAKILFQFVYQRVSHRSNTEDIVNEIFVKVYYNLSSYTAGSNFHAWILTIARHAVADFWRRQLSHPEVMLDENIHSSVLESYIADFLDVDRDKEQDKQEIHNQVASFQQYLNQKEWSVVQSRYLQQLSTKDTASKLKISISNVKVITHRALKKLSRILTTKS